MVRITVDCQKPKYAKGYFEVSKFEDIFHWLGTIKGLQGSTERRTFPSSLLLGENRACT